MVPSCAEGGVLGILCASIASVMGTEAIKLITGIGESLLGRLMIYDALDMTYRTIGIRKDPATPKITELIDYDAFCGVVSEDAQDAAAGHTITAAELKEMIDAANLAWGNFPLLSHGAIEALKQHGEAGDGAFPDRSRGK